MKTVRIEKLEELKYLVEDKERELEKFEIVPDDYEESYDDMLDDCYEEFMGTYSPSYTLKCVDETAWRMGLLDYVDNLDISDDKKYQALEEELEELREDLENLKSDYLDEILEEIEELEDIVSEQEEETDCSELLKELENLRKENDFIEQNF